jgi:pheromone shutdown protein TraB
MRETANHAAATALWNSRAMKSWATGLVAGFLVFFALLVAFGSGTGILELLLWLLIVVAVGLGTARLAGGLTAR